MNPFIFITLVLGLASALSKESFHPLSDEAIAEINNKQSTWKAARYFQVDEYDLFKTLASGAARPRTFVEHFREMIHDEDTKIPEEFDSRKNWPECADIIGTIRDQSRCGACWAFAIVETISDRICIHSNATRKILVSAEDMLACAGVGGCDGGDALEAWQAWERGLVPGGLYGHPEQGCKPYSLPPCEDHPNKCLNYVETPVCRRVCDDPALSYENKTYGLEPYFLKGEKQIQIEIMKNGPVEARMEMHIDIANYHSGIYQVTTDEQEGGHVVKIIGWGLENGIKFWIVQNSWNERWGENGYFRIIRGRNESGIEASIHAGFPDFTRF